MVYRFDVVYSWVFVFVSSLVFYLVFAMLLGLCVVVVFGCGECFWFAM